MNQLQKEVVNDLKEVSSDLGYSPGRREVPPLLNRKACNYFGSFNKAKDLAGLNITKRKCDPLPKRAYVKDRELVKLVSFLTCDGHLYKDLKGLSLYSNNNHILKKYENSIKKKFDIGGFYGLTGGFGYCESYNVFNVNICKFLDSIGVPKGDKMITSFDVPNWIKKNREFSRTYLKIAFLCEGCKYKASKNTERIQINLNKSEDLLNDGLKFMNSLRYMLKQFGINTTKIRVSKGNVRKKDGKITKCMRFEIRANTTNKFIKEIGWYK